MGFTLQRCRHVKVCDTFQFGLYNKWEVATGCNWWVGRPEFNLGCIMNGKWLQDVTDGTGDWSSIWAV
jgi:hypothetical protein